MLMLRNFTKLPVLRYLGIYNALSIWSVRAIPTYRVYQLYDITYIVLHMYLQDDGGGGGGGGRGVLGSILICQAQLFLCCKNINFYQYDKGHYHNISSKNSALLIIRHPLPND